MKKIDLTSQFIFFIAIILIGVIGSMNFWFYHDHSKHLTSSLEKTASAKLDFLESSTAYFLNHFEHELIFELGKKTMTTYRDMTFLSIRDADGNELFKQGIQKDENSRMFARNITVDNKVIGNIIFSLDIRQMLSNQHTTMLYTISLMIFSVSLIIGMIYLFYRKKILHEFDKINAEKDFLRDEYEFFMTIINTASNMVIVLDSHGYIMLVNQVFADALNSNTHALSKKHISSIIDFDCDGDNLKSSLSKDIASNFEAFSNNFLYKQCRSLLPSGDTEIHIEWKFSKLTGENGHIKFLTGMGVDITRQHQNQLELSHRAYHDHLTSLPNRALFNDRLQESFKQARRHSSLFAVLFLDLDHFKPINDKYGHTVGDLVLKVTAQRMLSVTRELDTVARLGGDEFGILLLDLKTKDNIDLVVEKILKEISHPIPYGEELLNISASIGVAFFSEDSKDAKELIDQADNAMYQAKKSGRNNYHFFNSEA